MTIEKALRVIADLAEKNVIKNYAITGAVAALNYVEASATEDVDVLASASNFPQRPSGLILLGSLEAALAERGYVQRTDAGIVVEDWPVQFIPAASPLDEEAIESRRGRYWDRHTAGGDPRAVGRTRRRPRAQDRPSERSCSHRPISRAGCARLRGAQGRPA